MKKIIAMCSLLLLPFIILGQTVDGVDKAHYNYGYGQEHKYSKEQVIVSTEGKNIEFNSAIDALNFMSLNNWRLNERTYYSYDQNEIQIEKYLMIRE